MCIRRGAGRAALAAVLAVVACSSGPTAPGGGNGTAGYSLSLMMSELVVMQGGSGTTSATLTRTGGFTGTVTLAATGVPAGMQVTFSPSSTSGATATITVVAGTVAPGIALITIRGSANDQADQAEVLTVTVIARGGTLGYTIALPPLPLRIAQGAQGTAFATLTRNGGFAGIVTFAASDIPAGVLVTFIPAATNGTETAITVSAGTAGAGTYVITIHGAASGLADQTADLTVTVTTGSSGTRTWAGSRMDAVLPTQRTFRDSMPSGSLIRRRP